MSNTPVIDANIIALELLTVFVTIPVAPVVACVTIESCARLIGPLRVNNVT